MFWIDLLKLRARQSSGVRGEQRSLTSGQTKSGCQLGICMHLASTEFNPSGFLGSIFLDQVLKNSF